ncbi:MAG TPA: hypothetical protein VLL47_00645, partial [Robiginitalea sp.]|nr:hypothetical protein [Robiginitalea sp.]
LSNTPEEYRAQQDFLLEVRDEVSRANQAIIRIRKLKKDLSFLRGKASGHPSLAEDAGAFEQKLSEIENAIHMTKNQSLQDPVNYGIRINNRLAFLLSDSQRGDYPPTEQAVAFFQEVREELSATLRALEDAKATYLRGINEKISALGIPMISEQP